MDENKAVLGAKGIRHKLQATSYRSQVKNGSEWPEIINQMLETMKSYIGLSRKSILKA